MNIESSPNYQDHNPNLLKSSSQNNVKKPTKKEDDLPVKSPIKKGLGNEDAKDKKKSGHLKTIPIMDDYEDEDEPESITFLNKEESKKALRNDKLKELTDKKRAR